MMEEEHIIEGISTHGTYFVRQFLLEKSNDEEAIKALAEAAYILDRPDIIIYLDTKHFGFLQEETYIEIVRNGIDTSIKHNSIKVFKMLSNRTYKKYDTEALELAYELDSIEIIEFLSGVSYAYTYYSKTLANLQLMIISGHLPDIEDLVNGGLDIKMYGMYAIETAIRRGQRGILKYMLEVGVRLDKVPVNILSVVAMNEDHKTLEILLEHYNIDDVKDLYYGINKYNTIVSKVILEYLLSNDV